ncbi:MAG: UDP-N-acetylmuramate dehydrogenase [Deltaproteobacteria bacterium]|nr:UDP-N-acetylmuramate dehydrogenase [Candidatus Anaeroferrophillacea bacterium]
MPALTLGIVARLREAFADRLRENVPLASRTTIGVGGPARVCLAPAGATELREMLRLLAELEIPAVILGGGSNVIPADAGLVDAVVISTVERLTDMTEVCRDHDQAMLICGAGVRMSALISWSRTSGYGGLEFLAGVPATIGGALAMNAGAFGESFVDYVDVCEVCDIGGCRPLYRDELRPGYRCGGLPAGTVAASVSLRLPWLGPEEVEARRQRVLTARRARQPWGKPSAGSMFRNPPGEYAGRLIDACGFRGRRRGTAVVAAEHANFIVTRPPARAADVLGLMTDIRTAVRERFGIDLEPEVVCWGGCMVGEGHHEHD